jgi:hypothetical protein
MPIPVFPAFNEQLLANRAVFCTRTHTRMGFMTKGQPDGRSTTKISQKVNPKWDRRSTLCNLKVLDLEGMKLK